VKEIGKKPLGAEPEASERKKKEGRGRVCPYFKEKRLVNSITKERERKTETRQEPQEKKKATRWSEVQ